MKETFGYKTPEAWFAHLREWKEELAQLVTVRIKITAPINRVETNTTKQKLRGIYQGSSMTLHKYSSLCRVFLFTFAIR